MNLSEIVNIRHQLHDNPGVSGSEEFAHSLICSWLKQLNPTALHSNVGGYGVVAYWKSDNPNAKTIAFRADTDALPIGHRCGHDGHTAIMLHFASMVATTALKHNVVLIFQPEEETGHGARKMAESGLLQKYNVAAVFGLHNLPGYATGTVVMSRGTFAAASTGVVYNLQGRATHASTPELGINPGAAVAEIIRQFDALNVNDGNRLRLATLICCRVGEEAFGTSAGNAQVMYTLRSDTNDAMQGLMTQADAIVGRLASEHGLTLAKELREPFRATENSTDLVAQMEPVFSSQIPTVMIDRPFRWSEDFAEYLCAFPGFFFGIGSGESQHELHHPDYDFPDGIIEPAAHCFELIMNNIKL